jgi:hypothetical protein
MTTKSDFISIAAPMRDNLKKAVAALSEFEASGFTDEEALGRLAKAAYLVSLGSRGLAALAVDDEDFAFVKGSNVILNIE